MTHARTVLVLWVCAFASGFALRAADPILPLVAADFDAPLASASILVTAFSLMYALSQLVFGPLGDHFGKPVLIIACGLGLALALGAGASAPSLPVLVAWRALAGFLAGAIIPLSVALIGELFSAEERQVGLARFLIGPILGQMLGAAASGAVGEAFGWRAVFIMSGALVAAATLAALLALGARRSGSAGGAFGAGTIARRYRSVLAEPGALRLYPLVFLGGAATFGVFPLVGIVLAARGEAGPFEAGLVLAGFGVGGVLFGAAIRPLLKRLGPARMGFLGAAAAGASMAAFALPIPWQACVPLFAILGFFYYMTHNTIQVQVSALSREAAGSAMSIFALSMFSAQGIGPLFYGVAFAALPTWLVLVGGGAVISLVGFLGARQTLARRTVALDGEGGL